MASDASDASDASHASDAIDYIQTLIQKGFAYELDRYVVFDWTAFAAVSTTKYPAPAPVQYPVIRGEMCSPLDFPLWAPYTGGRPSPWGNGGVTANVAYIRACLSTL